MSNAMIIQQYMALFNTIDKDLDQYVQSDGFMPFNEKLKHIIGLSIPISTMLSRFEQQLRFFGEIRNHLVHSFKLDGATYLLPTDDAIKELDRLVNILTKPPVCGSMCTNNLYIASLEDPLLSVMNTMKKQGIEHVPVVDENGYVCSVSYVLICDWITTHPDRDITKDLTVRTLLEDKSPDSLFPRHERGYQYEFIAADQTIYEAEQRFERMSHQLGALYITRDGASTSPLLGMITTADLTIMFRQL